MSRNKLAPVLHQLVFRNDAAALEVVLQTEQHDLEEKDLRGNTPLRLAVLLGHVQCSRLLINCGADVLGPTGPDGWSLVHEATAAGNPELLEMVLTRRNVLTQRELVDRFPQVLALLKESSDFYVEMAWQFSSLLPFVGRLCPSDAYRIWKKGASVRIDTTLIGFSQMHWQRGQRSFIFRATDAGGAEMIMLDHDRSMAVIEPLNTGAPSQEAASLDQEELSQRLDTPITTTVMDQGKAAFTRVRGGLWGFQSDVSEEIQGHECKVFKVSDLEIVTRTRFEHLPANHTARTKRKTPVRQLMGGIMGGGGAEEGEEEATAGLLEAAEEMEKEQTAVAAHTDTTPTISETDYFDPRFSAQGVILGRPREERVEKQNFKAKLWMSTTFPLSLQTQLLPVIDLLSPTSQHIAKLRDFISLQLPSGFPVKVEMPVYYVLNARVTFREYRPLSEADTAEVEALMTVPPAFSMYNTASDEGEATSEDQLMARMLQQNLYGDEALADMGDEAADLALQRALMASMLTAEGGFTCDEDLLPTSFTSVPESTEEWVCPACTFVNQPLGLCCEICGTERHVQPAKPTAALGQTEQEGADEEENLQRILLLSLTDN